MVTLTIPSKFYLPIVPSCCQDVFLVLSEDAPATLSGARFVRARLNQGVRHLGNGMFAENLHCVDMVQYSVDIYENQLTEVNGNEPVLTCDDVLEISPYTHTIAALLDALPE